MDNIDPDPYATTVTAQGGLNGMEIPVVGLADPEYQHRLTSTIYPNGTVVFRTGFDLDILLLLQFVLKFKYKAINGEGWVDHLPNGSWTGIGGQVMRDEAVLSIAQSSMVPDRSNAFYFLFRTAGGNMMASFRQPSRNSIRNMIASVFPFNVWICMFFIGVLTIIAMKSVQKLKERMETTNPKDYLLTQQAFFWVLGSFCQTSLYGSPGSIALRIVYLSLLTTTYFSYVGFSAALMAHLAVEIVPIKSFADLIRSDLPLLGDISIPYSYSTIESFQKLKNQKGKTKQNFVDVKTGVKIVSKGRASFVTYAEAVYIAFQQLGQTDQFICDNIYQVKVSASGLGTPGAMFVKKGSPLRGRFNIVLAMLFERGFMARANEKMNYQLYPRCDSSKKTSRPSLGFNDVYTAFVILVGGILSGLLIVVTEFWYRFIQRRNELY